MEVSPMVAGRISVSFRDLGVVITTPGRSETNTKFVCCIYFNGKSAIALAVTSEKLTSIQNICLEIRFKAIQFPSKLSFFLTFSPIAWYRD